MLQIHLHLIGLLSNRANLIKPHEHLHNGLKKKFKKKLLQFLKSFPTLTEKVFGLSLPHPRSQIRWKVSSLLLTPQLWRWMGQNDFLRRRQFWETFVTFFSFVFIFEHLRGYRFRYRFRFWNQMIVDAIFKTVTHYLGLIELAEGATTFSIMTLRIRRFLDP